MVLAASLKTAMLMVLEPTPRTDEAPPGPGSQILPTPGHAPLVDRLEVGPELVAAGLPVDGGDPDVADVCEQATAVSITAAVATGIAARRRSTSLFPNTLGSSSDICDRVVGPKTRTGSRC